MVSLFFAGGESKSVPARELDDRRENKRNAAVLPCGGKDGNANDEKTKIPFFNVMLDPKEDWAVRHLECFPVEINRAPYADLLRVDRKSIV